MDIEMIYEERRRRFSLLVDNYDDQSDAAEQLGFGGPAPVSNIKTGKKNMGETVARRVEKLAKLPEGTFVTPFSVPWRLYEKAVKDSVHYENDGVTVSAPTTQDEHNDDHSYIQSYELWSGDVTSEARHMSVPASWLDIEGYKADQIKSIEMPDNSQLGLVSAGFEIAINIDWGGTLKNDLYYALKIGGQITIRRIEFQANGSLFLRCLNDAFMDEHVNISDIQTLGVVGIAVRFQGNFPKSR